MFDTLDGIDTLTEGVANLLPSLDRLDALIPQMVTILPPMIATMKTMRTMTLTMHTTFGGLQDQMAAFNQNATAMGQAFDTSKMGDSFYLPPEAFQNPDRSVASRCFSRRTARRCASPSLSRAIR